MVAISAIVDTQSDPPAAKMARSMGLAVQSDYQTLLRDEKLDMILNLTGDPELQHALGVEKLPGTLLIGRETARLVWTTLEPHERRDFIGELFQKQKNNPLRGDGGFIVGKGEAMGEVMTMIQQVAATPTTVLIRGESGTGKEMVARLIHTHSQVRNKPLVTVNCTAFSASLIESELFGYKKGAFTGANADRTGLLELADEGTIFLDEVGDMPIEMQAKLLRFLQSGEIRPVGGFQTRKVRVRVLAATNRNLEEAIRKGTFRSDLFYRLNAFTIYTPPLRDRRGDLPELAYFFLKLVSEKVKKPVTHISPAALRAFQTHDWPGNIRELKNAIERATVLTNTHQIELDHLPRPFQDCSPALEANDLAEGLMALKARMIDRFEYEAICRYLEESGGNVSRAADAAGVPRRTFQRLMAKHRLSSDVFKSAPLRVRDSDRVG